MYVARRAFGLDWVRVYYAIIQTLVCCNLPNISWISDMHGHV